MRIRDTWLLEDIRAFDEPSDWTTAPELTPLLRPELEEDTGFRSLLHDPEACETCETCEACEACENWETV